MEDKVLEGFLKRQYDEAMALAEASDLLDLAPIEGDPPRLYAARFRCKGFVKTNGDVRVADRFEVGIWFPDDYLRDVVPSQIVAWRGPRNVFHPNISDKAPVICLGHLGPSTRLVDILYQIFEIITYNKVTMREDDALNLEACKWARHNQHRFPIDRRPLKRRSLRFSVQNVQASETPHD